MLTMEFGLFLSPQRMQCGELLVEYRAAFRRVDAMVAHLPQIPSDPDAEHRAPAGKGRHRRPGFGRVQHIALGKQRHPRADNQPLGGRRCVREHHRQVADQRQPRAKLGIDRVGGIDGEVGMIIEEQPFKAALLDSACEHIRGHVSVG